MNYSFLSACLRSLPTEIIDIVLHYYGKNRINHNIFAEQLNLDKYKILLNIPRIYTIRTSSYYTSSVQLKEWQLSITEYDNYYCHYFCKPIRTHWKDHRSLIYYHKEHGWIYSVAYCPDH